MAVGVTLSGVLGMFMGNSFLEGILYIGIPMTSGGMTAGSVPLSEMYSSVLGADAGAILTRIAPATVLGNCVAIVFGALAGNLGEKKPHLTGNGRLVNDGNEIAPRPPMKPTFALLCTGLIISLAFYELALMPPLHIRYPHLCVDDYCRSPGEGDGDYVGGAGGCGQRMGAFCHP